MGAPPGASLEPQTHMGAAGSSPSSPVEAMSGQLLGSPRLTTGPRPGAVPGGAKSRPGFKYGDPPSSDTPGGAGPGDLSVCLSELPGWFWCEHGWAPERAAVGMPPRCVPGEAAGTQQVHWEGRRRFGERAAAVAQGGLVSRSAGRGEPWRHSEGTVLRHEFPNDGPRNKRGQCPAGMQGAPFFTERSHPNTGPGSGTRPEG